MRGLRVGSREESARGVPKPWTRSMRESDCEYEDTVGISSWASVVHCELCVPSMLWLPPTPCASPPCLRALRRCLRQLLSAVPC